MSRVSSNRRGTIQIKDQETEAKIEHPNFFIDITQSELFQTFKQEFSNMKIYQRMFNSLHPSFVCINKIHETFCCRKHVKFGLHMQSYKIVMVVLY